MAQEKQYEDKIKKFLSKVPNTYFFKFWAGRFSKRGVPDIICCIKGRFVGIEVKAERGKPTPIQVKNVREINESGGYAVIAYPKDFEKLKEDLINISKGKEVIAWQ